MGLPRKRTRAMAEDAPSVEAATASEAAGGDSLGDAAGDASGAGGGSPEASGGGSPEASGGEESELVYSVHLVLGQDLPRELGTQIFDELRPLILEAVFGTVGASRFEASWPHGPQQFEDALHRGIRAAGRGPLIRCLRRVDAETLALILGELVDADMVQWEAAADRAAAAEVAQTADVAEAGSGEAGSGEDGEGSDDEEGEEEEERVHDEEEEEEDGEGDEVEDGLARPLASLGSLSAFDPPARDVMARLPPGGRVKVAAPGSLEELVRLQTEFVGWDEDAMRPCIGQEGEVLGYVAAAGGWAVLVDCGRPGSPDHIVGWSPACLQRLGVALPTDIPAASAADASGEDEEAIVVRPGFGPGLAWFPLLRRQLERREEDTPIEIGDCVLANVDEGVWLLGTVTARRDSGTFNVDLPEGDKEEGIPRESLVKVQVVGDGARAAVAAGGDSAIQAPKFAKGTVVRLSADQELATRSQEGFGGWAPMMAKCLGQSGHVCNQNGAKVQVISTAWPEQAFWWNATLLKSDVSDALVCPSLHEHPLLWYRHSSRRICDHGCGSDNLREAFSCAACGFDACDACAGPYLSATSSSVVASRHHSCLLRRASLPQAPEASEWACRGAKLPGGCRSTWPGREGEGGSTDLGARCVRCRICFCDGCLRDPLLGEATSESRRRDIEGLPASAERIRATLEANPGEIFALSEAGLFASLAKLWASSPEASELAVWLGGWLSMPPDSVRAGPCLVEVDVGSGTWSYARVGAYIEIGGDSCAVQMGITEGTRVEVTATMYANQGPRYQVMVGWQGTVTRVNDSGSVTVRFDAPRAAKRVRRQDLGNMKVVDGHLAAAAAEACVDDVRPDSAQTKPSKDAPCKVYVVELVGRELATEVIEVSALQLRVPSLRPPAVIAGAPEPQAKQLLAELSKGADSSADSVRRLLAGRVDLLSKREETTAISKALHSRCSEAVLEALLEAHAPLMASAPEAPTSLHVDEEEPLGEEGTGEEAAAGTAEAPLEMAGEVAGDAIASDVTAALERCTADEESGASSSAVDAAGTATSSRDATDASSVVTPLASLLARRSARLAGLLAARGGAAARAAAESMRAEAEDVHANARAFSGTWTTPQSNSATFKGGKVQWADGKVNQVRYCGSNKCILTLRGKAYEGTHSDVKITWDDGDVWERAPSEQVRADSSEAAIAEPVNIDPVESTRLACLDCAEFASRMLDASPPSGNLHVLTQSFGTELLGHILDKVVGDRSSQPDPATHKGLGSLIGALLAAGATISPSEIDRLSAAVATWVTAHLVQQQMGLKMVKGLLRALAGSPLQVRFAAAFRRHGVVARLEKLATGYVAFQPSDHASRRPHRHGSAVKSLEVEAGRIVAMLPPAENPGEAERAVESVCSLLPSNEALQRLSKMLDVGTCTPYELAIHGVPESLLAVLEVEGMPQTPLDASVVRSLVPALQMLLGLCESLPVVGAEEQAMGGLDSLVRPLELALEGTGVAPRKLFVEPLLTLGDLERFVLQTTPVDDKAYLEWCTNLVGQHVLERQGESDARRTAAVVAFAMERELPVHTLRYVAACPDNWLGTWYHGIGASGGEFRIHDSSDSDGSAMYADREGGERARSGMLAFSGRWHEAKLFLKNGSSVGAVRVRYIDGRGVAVQFGNGEGEWGSTVKATASQHVKVLLHLRDVSLVDSPEGDVCDEPWGLEDEIMTPVDKSELGKITPELDFGAGMALTPGIYRVSQKVVVTTDSAVGSQETLELEAGTLVVAEVVQHVPESNHDRGRLTEPAGWISLRNTGTGEQWAVVADVGAPSEMATLATNPSEPVHKVLLNLPFVMEGVIPFDMVWEEMLLNGEAVVHAWSGSTWAALGWLGGQHMKSVLESSLSTVGCGILARGLTRDQGAHLQRRLSEACGDAVTIVPDPADVPPRASSRQEATQPTSTPLGAPGAVCSGVQIKTNDSGCVVAAVALWTYKDGAIDAVDQAGHFLEAVPASAIVRAAQHARSGRGRGMPLELSVLGLSAPADSAVDDAAEAAGSHWEYQGNEDWETFAEEANKALEDSFQNGRTTHDLRGPDHRYEVDLVALTQTNMSHPARRVRNIRRVPGASSSAPARGVAGPSQQRPQLQRQFSALSRDPVSDFERKILDKGATWALNSQLYGLESDVASRSGGVPPTSKGDAGGMAGAGEGGEAREVAVGKPVPRLRVRFFAPVAAGCGNEAYPQPIATMATVLQALLHGRGQPRGAPGSGDTGRREQRLRCEVEVLQPGAVQPPPRSPSLGKTPTGVSTAAADGIGGQVAQVLAVLRRLRRQWEGSPGSDEGCDDSLVWENNALSNKLEHQMAQPLLSIGGVAPQWVRTLPQNYPFLFGVKLREQLLHCTGFGASHAVRWLQRHLVENRYGRELRTVRDRARAGSNRDAERIWDLHERVARDEAVFVGPGRSEKAEIPSRAQLPDFAERVVELTHASKALLEVVFRDEPAFGDGVTQSFYTDIAFELVCDDSRFRGTELLWVEHLPQSVLEIGGRRVLHSKRGLFPRPHAPGSSESATACRLFRFLGRLITKALRDGFVVPLPLSTVFLAAVLGDTLSASALPRPGDGWQGELVGALAQFAAELRAKCADLGEQERSQVYDEEARKKGWASRFMKSEADDSFADYAQWCVFCATGAGGAELCEGGAERTLDIAGLDEFVELAERWWLGDGIQPQVDAFRRGVEDVCESPSIWAFGPKELRELLCGCAATWTREELERDLQPSSTSSREPGSAFAMLLDALDDLSLEKRGRFVEFVTGCPRLPPGGIAGAGIKVTELRGEVDTLPRAHTCTHELQLPKYSSAEKLAERLLEALECSQGMDDSHF